MTLGTMFGASFRKIVYNQLETQHREGKGLSVANWGLLFLILFSLILYTAETEQEIEMASSGFLWSLNVAILSAFLAEFVLRLYSVGADPKYKGWTGLWRYAKSNWVMISVDFVAFAPELVWIAMGLGPPSWLRSFRVMRLFKMARYIKAFNLVIDAVGSRVQELLVAFSVSAVLWYLASVLLYLAEHEAQPEAFGSITRTMWWSVITLTTVGYGDLYPVTALGKVVAGMVAVVGLGTVALPSGIIAGAFMEAFRERREMP